MTRAFIYIRVSSESQDDAAHGHISLSVQEHECYKYCSDMHYPIEAIYGDIGSARNMNKLPYFQKMLREVKDGDIIVFYNITRFSRNTRQALNTINKLINKGVSLYSVGEKCGYDTTATKHLFRTTLVVAENESDMISDRIKANIRYRKRRGDIFGRIPYGYDSYRTAEGIRKLKLNKPEQIVIKRIIKLHKQKFNKHQIASKLNIRKIFKRNHLHWTYSSIYNVIKRHLSPLENLSSMRNALDHLSDDSDQETEPMSITPCFVDLSPSTTTTTSTTSTTSTTNSYGLRSMVPLNYNVGDLSKHSLYRHQTRSRSKSF